MPPKSPGYISISADQSRAISGRKLIYLRDDGSDPEYSDVSRVVPNLMGVYHLASFGRDYLSAADGCEHGKVAIQDAAIPFLLARGFLKKKDETTFTQGENTPVFSYRVDAPKEERVGWVGRTFSTLSAIAKTEDAVIPLVAHVCQDVSSFSKIAKIRKKLLRALGFTVPKDFIDLEKSLTQKGENINEYDVFTIVSMAAVPKRKG